MRSDATQEYYISFRFFLSHFPTLIVRYSFYNINFKLKEIAKLISEIYNFLG